MTCFTQTTIKNRCEGCSKFILLHNKILSCEICGKIVHSQCAKNLFEYNQIKYRWQCCDCTLSETARYNPFSTISRDKYDPVGLAEFDDVTEISKILENCQNYDSTKFRDLIKLNSEENSTMSVLFNNIDGNSSNFDSFVSEIAQYKHSFSCIGIAETNVSSSAGDLYKIPGYNSIYGDKILGKSKGSGIAIYIKENFNFCEIIE